MVVVRHATLADRRAWHRMRCALWPEGSQGEHDDEIGDFFRGRSKEPVAVLIASGDGDEALGFAELSIRPYAEGCETDRVAYLEGWYVAPDTRRRGVGRALVEAAEAWAIEQGCTEFASDALIDNDVSTAAHHALGFEEVEQIRCFRKVLTEAPRPAAAMEAVARAGDVVVHQAGIRDAEALARLVTELGYPSSLIQMRSRLEAIIPAREYLTLVARVNSSVAGFVGAMVRPSYEHDGLYGQIMALVVSADYRRRGVGRALVRAAEASLARLGVGTVVVNTANHRADAHAFYENTGYRFTGRRYRKSLA